MSSRGRQFVPVVDTETPRAERDNDSADMAKHRRFDNPHAVKGALKPKTDRGWSQGSVGWGVQGFFGSVEEDKGEHIAAKQEFNLVKDEFGRWVDPKKKARAAALRKQREGEGAQEDDEAAADRQPLRETGRPRTPSPPKLVVGRDVDEFGRRITRRPSRSRSRSPPRRSKSRSRSPNKREAARRRDDERPRRDYGDDRRGGPSRSPAAYRGHRSRSPPGRRYRERSPSPGRGYRSGRSPPRHSRRSPDRRQFDERRTSDMYRRGRSPPPADRGPPASFKSGGKAGKKWDPEWGWI